jgi:hypothetical protein
VREREKVTRREGTLYAYDSVTSGFVRVYAHLYARAYTHMCMYVHVHVCACACMCICTYLCALVPVCVCVCVCVGGEGTTRAHLGINVGGGACVWIQHEHAVVLSNGCGRRVRQCDHTTTVQSRHVWQAVPNAHRQREGQRHRHRESTVQGRVARPSVSCDAHTRA